MCFGISVSSLHVFVDLQLVGLGTVDGVNDVPVGSANGKQPDGSLRCGTVDRDIAIVQKHLEVLLLVDAVV